HELGGSSDRRQALSPLLLTTQPLETLQDDLVVLKMLAPSFRTIVDAIYFALYQDPEADSLRASFLTFYKTTYKVAKQVDDLLDYSRVCYVQSLETDPNHITDEMLDEYRDLKWQQVTTEGARRIAREAKDAANILRTAVMPMLPSLEQEISTYIDSYRTRYDPDYHQPLASRFWGILNGSSLRPAQWNLEGVMSLAIEFRHGSALLKRVPWFLDNVELHFWRLSRLNAADLVTLGYKTLDDFRRLYVDRLRSFIIIINMSDDWLPIFSAFEHGVLDGKLRS
ncbi:hypothetical protein FRC17_007377, partial [Serendipita sp. 399]